jgi:hypothetical protein
MDFKNRGIPSVKPSAASLLITGFLLASCGGGGANTPTITQLPETPTVPATTPTLASQEATVIQQSVLRSGVHRTPSELLKTDSSGNIQTAWTDNVSFANNGITADVNAARYSAATGTWTATKLGARSIDTSIAHAINATGAGLVTWSERLAAETSARRLVAMRYDPSTNTWSVAGQVDGFQDGPVVLDSAANAIAVSCIQGGGLNGSRIRAVQYDARSNSWGAIQQLQTAERGCETPKLVVDANGNAIAMWSEAHYISQRLEVDNSALLVARYNAATKQWSAPVPLYESPAPIASTPANTPAITIDTAGNATVAWISANGFFASRYSAASNSWSNATKFADIDSNPLIIGGAKIATDSAGNVVGVWAENSFSANGTLRTVRFDARSNAWTGAKTILTGPFDIFDLAVNDNGNAILVGRQYDRSDPTRPTESSRPFAMRYDMTSDSWTPPGILAPFGSGSVGPRVAIDAAGAAAVAWLRQTGSDLAVGELVITRLRRTW